MLWLVEKNQKITARFKGTWQKKLKFRISLKSERKHGNGSSFCEIWLAVLWLVEKNQKITARFKPARRKKLNARISLESLHKRANGSSFSQNLQEKVWKTGKIQLKSAVVSWFGVWFRYITTAQSHQVHSCLYYYARTLSVKPLHPHLYPQRALYIENRS